MKAICWYGKEDVRLTEVEEPRILQPTDAIIKVTSSAICGSDLHMYDGFVPFMQKGDVLGHESMGVVTEVGSAVERLQVGDRVVVAFPIACGKCWYCENQMYSLCDNSNPDRAIPEKMYGDSPAGLYGYSHAYGGFAGGQAEYLRVPFADNGHVKVPENLTDEEVLFLSDILPTGWAGADWCDIEEGDSVAVFGAGPVGQFSAIAAREMGADLVFVIDQVEGRLALAEQQGAVGLSRERLGKTELLHALRSLTGGRGPDACIDAVGMEAGDGLMGAYDRVKQALRLENDRPEALREAVLACRKAGHVSVPGVYTGLIDKFPMGAVFGKGLTLRGGQTPVQRYTDTLLDLISRGQIDPTFVISHRVGLEEVPDMYHEFRDHRDEVMKVVIHT